MVAPGGSASSRCSRVRWCSHARAAEWTAATVAATSVRLAHGGGFVSTVATCGLRNSRLSNCAVDPETNAVCAPIRRVFIAVVARFVSVGARPRPE